MTNSYYIYKSFGTFLKQERPPGGQEKTQETHYFQFPVDAMVVQTPNRVKVKDKGHGEEKNEVPLFH